MDYEEYKRKALEPIVNYIESVMASYSKEELEARIKKALPEKESEDERIRTEIVNFISRNAERGDDIVKSTEWIAYLEKQKECSFCNFQKSCDDCPKEIQAAIDKEFGIDGRDDNDNPLNGYGDWKKGMVLNGPAILGLVELGTELHKEQPAEWSEDYRGEDLRTRFAFYTYKDEDDALYLSNVFVEETSRNKGFGTKILAAAEKVAETIGAINIRLKVKQNSPANAWYRKHGYGYMAFEGDYDWLEKTLEYLKPINPEWSEEDKEDSDIICEIIDHCISIPYIGGTLHLSDERKKELKTFVKSLRPQPKQEVVDRTVFDRIADILRWCDLPIGCPIEDFKQSESEREHLLHIVQCVAHRYANSCTYCKEYSRGYQDGLSVPHWKPSDEQIDTLEAVVGMIHPADTRYDAVFGLLEELKAL